MKKLLLLIPALALGVAAVQAQITLLNPHASLTNRDWAKQVQGSTNAGDFIVTAVSNPWVGSWANRLSTDDVAIGTNLGDNLRFGSNPGTMVASADLSTSTQFVSFTVTNNSSLAYTIDSFRFGLGRNSNSTAWVYSTIQIGSAAQTALTANSTASTAAISADWSNPLIQFGDTTANRWAKPVYNGLGISLGVNETATFRIYLTGTATAMRFHLNDLNVAMTPIPEPSTYAALFGLLALGFVAYRRRRR